MRLKFKMHSIKQVVSQIRSEDWFVTIDLKDAYFQISILPQHRKFLRFAFRGKAYQYRVLSFGLALSPCTFTKCGCSSGSLATPEHPHTKLHRWLVDSSSIRVISSSALRYRSRSHERLGVKAKRKEMCYFLQYRGSLIWAWCGIRPSCRHVCLLLVPSRSSQQSREWEKASHSLWRFFKSCWVWWKLRFGLLHMRPLQWLLKTTVFSQRGNPFLWSRSHVDAYVP